MSKQNQVRVTDTHVYFWGGIFSNFYKTTIEIGDLDFRSSEQIFMYNKAKLFGDKRNQFLILGALTPKEAKNLGRQVKNFNSEIWDDNKYEIMVKALLHKFKNPKLKKELLKHDGKIFVEGNPYDKIWGVGLRWDSKEILDESNWKGENLLGKALNEVLNILKLSNGLY